MSRAKQAQRNPNPPPPPNYERQLGPTPGPLVSEQSGGVVTPQMVAEHGFADKEAELMQMSLNRQIDALRSGGAQGKVNWGGADGAAKYEACVYALGAPALSIRVKQVHPRPNDKGKFPMSTLADYGKLMDYVRSWWDGNDAVVEWQIYYGGKPIAFDNIPLAKDPLVAAAYAKRLRDMEGGASEAHVPPQLPAGPSADPQTIYDPRPPPPAGMKYAEPYVAPPPRAAPPQPVWSPEYQQWIMPVPAAAPQQMTAPGYSQEANQDLREIRNMLHKAQAENQMQKELLELYKQGRQPAAPEPARASPAPSQVAEMRDYLASIGYRIVPESALAVQQAAPPAAIVPAAAPPPPAPPPTLQEQYTQMFEPIKQGLGYANSVKSVAEQLGLVPQEQIEAMKRQHEMDDLRKQLAELKAEKDKPAPAAAVPGGPNMPTAMPIPGTEANVMVDKDGEILGISSIYTWLGNMPLLSKAIGSATKEFKEAFEAKKAVDLAPLEAKRQELELREKEIALLERQRALSRPQLPSAEVALPAPLPPQARPSFPQAAPVPAGPTPEQMAATRAGEALARAQAATAAQAAAQAQAALAAQAVSAAVPPPPAGAAPEPPVESLYDASPEEVVETHDPSDLAPAPADASPQESAAQLPGSGPGEGRGEESREPVRRPGRGRRRRVLRRAGGRGHREHGRKGGGRRLRRDRRRVFRHLKHVRLLVLFGKLARPAAHAGRAEGAPATHRRRRERRGGQVGEGQLPDVGFSVPEHGERLLSQSRQHVRGRSRSHLANDHRLHRQGKSRRAEKERKPRASPRARRGRRRFGRLGVESWFFQVNDRMGFGVAILSVLLMGALAFLAMRGPASPPAPAPCICSCSSVLSSPPAAAPPQVTP